MICANCLLEFRRRINHCPYCDHKLVIRVEGLKDPADKHFPHDEGFGGSITDPVASRMDVKIKGRERKVPRPSRRYLRLRSKKNRFGKTRATTRKGNLS